MESSNDTAHTCLVQVKDPRGLHLRLASAICAACNEYPGAVVMISRVGGKRAFDARSPLGLLCLEAVKDDMLMVSCTGDGAEAIQAQVRDIIATTTYGSGGAL